MGDLETVTVVFTDLVGSTAMATELGDVAVDGLRNQHFSRLRSVVEHTGGEVVKNLGDGLMIVYRSAGDAIGGAVAMQQAVHSTSLTMKIGVSAGDAAPQEGDWFGTPVNEAARLCGVATAGVILVSDQVRALASLEGAITDDDFEAVEPLELKGLPARFVAHRVMWPEPRPGPDDDEVEHEAAHRFPPELGRACSYPVVGQQGEIARGVEQWRAVRRDERVSVVTIAADPGMGKTRLAAELAQLAAGDGAVVLFGSSMEATETPFAPWIEALAPAIAASGVARVRRWLGPRTDDLARLLPELERRWGLQPRPTDPETERVLLFEAVAALLAGVAAEPPTSVDGGAVPTGAGRPRGLVVVLDDAQWSDPASLLLLRFVARRLRSVSPALFVLTYRDREIDDGQPLQHLLLDLQRQHVMHALKPTALGRAEIAALAEQRLGLPVADSVVDLLHAQTAGTPYFVEAYVAHLLESGALACDGEATLRTGGSDRPPETVRLVIGQRLGRLGAASEQLLRTAAVIGMRFPLSLLSGVRHQGVDATWAELDGAIAAGLVSVIDERRGWCAFDHALVRATLLDGLAPLRRASMHLSVARALDDTDEHLPELAQHYAGASSLVPTDALEVLVRAAAQATRLLAFETTVGHLRTALGLLDAAVPDDATRRERRAELLLEMGQALVWRFAIADARDCIAEAAELAFSAGRADLVSGGLFILGRVPVMTADESDLVVSRLPGLLDEMVPDDDSVERVHVMAFQAAGRAVFPLVGAGDLAVADQQADDALAMARRLGEPMSIALAQIARFFGRCGRYPSDEFVAMLDEVERCLRAAGHEMDALEVHAQRNMALLLVGDIAGASQEAEALLAYAREHDLPLLVYWARKARLAIAMVEGRYDDARRGNEETAAPDDPAARWYASEAPMRANLIDAMSGKVDAIIAATEQVLPAAPMFPTIWAQLGALYAEAGRFDDARSAIAELGPELERLRHDRFFSHSLVRLAEAAVRLGDAALASVLEPLLTPFGGSLVAFSFAIAVGPSVDRALGQCAWLRGRVEEALLLLDGARRFEQSCGAAGLVPTTTYWLARVLLARDEPGDVDRARSLLVEARAMAERQGSSLVVADIDDLGRLDDRAQDLDRAARPG